MKVESKNWFNIAIISIIVFISLVIFANKYIYDTHISALEVEYKSELNSVTELKSKDFKTWRWNVERSIFLLLKSPDFDKTLYNYIKVKKDEENAKKINKFYQVFLEGNFINGVVIVDKNFKQLYNYQFYDLNQKVVYETDKKIKKIDSAFTVVNSPRNQNKYVSKVENTDFYFDSYGELRMQVITPATYMEGEKVVLFGYIIYDVDLVKSFAPILRDFGKGHKVYQTEVSYPIYDGQGSVIKVIIAKPTSLKREIYKSYIPIYNKRNVGFSKGDYHGIVREGELAFVKIRKYKNSDWFYITKINLKKFEEYKSLFAGYLVAFSVVLIASGLILIFVFYKYHQTVKIKEAYNLLIEKQTYQVRYDTLLKNAGDAIILFDNLGGILECNEKATKLYLYNQLEMKNLTILDLWEGAEYLKIVKPLLNSNIKEGIVFESKNIKKDNNVFSVEVSMSQIEIEEKIFFQAIIRDITGRKIAEKELYESKEKYQELVENINDVLFTVNSNGDITFISPVIENILGYEVIEMFGHNFLNYVSPDERHKLLTRKKVLFSSETQTNFVTLIKKNGDACFVKTSTKARINRKNEYLITGILTDITHEKKLERMLDKEREDLKTIINLSPIAIYFKDKNNKYIRVNKSAATIANLDINNVEGKSAEEIFPIGYEKYYKDDIEIINTGESKFNILEELLVNNKKKFLRSDKVPWYDDSGNIAGIICFSVDITEQINAEKDLQKEKNLLQWILSTIPVGLIYIDNYGNLLLENKTAENIFGIDFSGDIKYKFNSPELTFYTLDGYPIDEKQNPFFLAGSTKETVKDIELLYINNSGNKVLLSINASPLISKNGNFEGVVASIEDITNRKKAEEALISSEKRYRSLFESMQEGFGLHKVIYDQNNKPIDYVFLEVNPAYEKITGISSKELLGRSVKQVLPIVEDIWIEKFGEVATNCGYVEFESYSEALNKYFKASAFSSQQGFFAMLFEDVTERKKTEKELQEYREDLEKIVKERTGQLNESNALLKEEIEKGTEMLKVLTQTLEQVKNYSDLKTRFISTASHEFRTPLSTMLMSVELLQRYGSRWTKEQLTEQTDRIISAIERIKNLVDDVLAVSRVDAGKINYNPEFENFYKFCWSIVDTYKNNPSYNINIIFNYNLKENMLFFDTRFMTTIYNNILSNAVKYSPMGESIIFTIWSDENSIIAEIEDRGIGISEIDFKYLFEPFHRGANVNQIDGTGLGMSIVKNYLNLIDGQIFVESKINIGTKVKIIIPKFNEEKNI